MAYTPESQGAYSPSFTAVTGFTTPTSFQNYYFVLGKYVIGFGYINATGIIGVNTIKISLPVASNFVSSTDLTGVVKSGNSVTDIDGLAIAGDSSSDTILISGTSAGTANIDLFYNYMYIIK